MHGFFSDDVCSNVLTNSDGKDLAIVATLSTSLRSAALEACRSFVPEVKECSWIGLLRWARLLDYVYRFDQWGQGFIPEPRAGSWLNCWSGQLTWNNEVSMTHSFRLFRPVLQDALSTTCVLRSRSLDSLKVCLPEHLQATRIVPLCAIPSSGILVMVTNDPTPEQIAITQHANFMGAAQQWRGLSELLETLEDLPADKCMLFSDLSHSIFVLPYARLRAISVEPARSVPSDAQSLYMGGHGTSQSVLGLIF